MISIWKMDPFPQKKKEFTLDSSFLLLAFLGSRRHTYTHQNTHTHTIPNFLTSNFKITLLLNLTNFKTNIRKSMHGMRCTTSKRARHTTDKTREDESTPFLCEVWINTYFCLGLGIVTKVPMLNLWSQKKRESSTWKKLIKKRKFNKDNGGWVLLFLFSKRIGCNCNEVIYSIVFLHHLLKEWRKTHTHTHTW